MSTIQVTKPMDNLARVSSQLLLSQKGQVLDSPVRMGNWAVKLTVETEDVTREGVKRVAPFAFRVAFSASITQLQRFTIGVSRERDIMVLGTLLTIGFLAISPFASLLVLPSILYGFYTYRADKKKLNAIKRGLQLS